MGSDIEPCEKVPQVDIDLEFDGHKWGYDLKSGSNHSVDIPGLDFDIPVIGSAGAVLDYSLTLHESSGAETVGIWIGIDACVSVFGIHKCGADLTSDLPLELFDGSFDISDFCAGAANATRIRRA